MNQTTNGSSDTASSSTAQPTVNSNTMPISEAHLDAQVDRCEESYEVCAEARSTTAEMIKNYESGEITDFSIIEQAVQRWGAACQKHVDDTTAFHAQFNQFTSGNNLKMTPRTFKASQRMAEISGAHLAAELAVQKELLDIVVWQQGDTEYVQGLKKYNKETREAEKLIVMMRVALGLVEDQGLVAGLDG
jgi:hypothetical protein